jgi:hypothetical protein
MNDENIIALKRRTPEERGAYWEEQFLKIMAEKAALRRRVEELEEWQEDAIKILKMCFRKHCMADDYSQDIGWNELSAVLQNALANLMGSCEFDKWLCAVRGEEED